MSNTRKNIFICLILIAAALMPGCKKEADKKQKEEVSLTKKYSKWNYVKVYSGLKLKKRIAYLYKGESVDLLGTEKTTIKNKDIELAKVKLSDDKIGFVKMSSLADKTVIFTEDTKAYVRNNITSKIYAVIPEGTMGFIISEKGNWTKIFAGYIYDETGKKKWIDGKWVKEGFTDKEELIPEARTYGEAVTALNKVESSLKAIEEAKDKLKKLAKDSSSFFAELAKAKLKEEELKEVDSPETSLTDDSSNEKLRYVASKSGLRMRDAPDISANKIDVIPNREKVELLEETGEAVTISGATGKWSKVKWKDKTGWVFGGFLTKSTQ